MMTKSFGLCILSCSFLGLLSGTLAFNTASIGITGPQRVHFSQPRGRLHAMRGDGSQLLQPVGRLRMCSELNDGNVFSDAANSRPVSRRRSFFRFAIATGSLLLGRPISTKAEEDNIVAKGTLSLKDGSKGLEGGAIYVTARLAGVMKGISTGRDLSPVASIKIPIAQGQTLPLDFVLSRDNLTPEALGSGGTWWQNKELTLSARWDEDADAGTRGPNDLVGRTSFKPRGDTAVLQLQGRGAAGRFATQKR